jgi:hypothetical protein
MAPPPAAAHRTRLQPQEHAPMDSDDLPPTPYREEGSFSGELGGAIGGFFVISLISGLVVFGLFLMG